MLHTGRRIEETVLKARVEWSLEFYFYNFKLGLIMKRCTILLVSLAFFFSFSGIVAAAPFTWVDEIDWDPNIYIHDGSGFGELYDGFGYYHNIADDGFQSSWMGGDDTISSFSLEISLLDEKDGTKYSFESADIYAPFFDGSYNFTLNSDTFGGTIAGWVDLMHDGTLNVFIEPTAGDFLADWSKLTVDGDDGTAPAPVPEPATMLLLGSGLVGLAGASRKKFLKKK
jgi:hypothetical protein